MDRRLILAIAVFILLLILAGGVSLYALQPADKGSLVVYGSKTCPWCVKQEEYLTNKGIPYEFVECAGGACPDFVNGFPTMMHNGKILKGYTEL